LLVIASAALLKSAGSTRLPTNGAEVCGAGVAAATQRR
jgi:hypothetical protein